LAVIFGGGLVAGATAAYVLPLLAPEQAQPLFEIGGAAQGIEHATNELTRRLAPLVLAGWVAGTALLLLGTPGRPSGLDCAEAAAWVAARRAGGPLLTVGGAVVTLATAAFLVPLLGPEWSLRLLDEGEPAHGLGRTLGLLGRQCSPWGTVGLMAGTVFLLVGSRLYHGEGPAPARQPTGKARLLECPAPVTSSRGPAPRGT
jgi:hypothetical protein